MGSTVQREKSVGKQHIYKYQQDNKIQYDTVMDFALPPVNIDAAKHGFGMAWPSHGGIFPRHSTLEKMTRAFSMSSWDS